MDTFRGADKKLGELMLRGWTMLADCCQVSNCRCPLMRSPDGQKYCVNCEAWIYDNKKREQKKFNELIPSLSNQMKNQKQMFKEGGQKVEKKENQENQKKIENQVKEKEDKSKKIKNVSNETVIELLEKKLKYLGQSLNEETNIKKCEEIIQLMDKIMLLIEHYKKINN